MVSVTKACLLRKIFQALFRIAVGLMKVQQPALLQLSCPLEIMQYMKRAARVTYDKDQLFKVQLYRACLGQQRGLDPSLTEQETARIEF